MGKFAPTQVVISNDLERLIEVFSDTKYRAVYLWQLSFLLLCVVANCVTCCCVSLSWLSDKLVDLESLKRLHVSDTVFTTWHQMFG